MYICVSVCTYTLISYILANVTGGLSPSKYIKTNKLNKL